MPGPHQAKVAQAFEILYTTCMATCPQPSKELRGAWTPPECGTRSRPGCASMFENEKEFATSMASSGGTCATFRRAQGETHLDSTSLLACARLRHPNAWLSPRRP